MLKISQVAINELEKMLKKSPLDKGLYYRLAIKPLWTGPGDFGIVKDKKLTSDLIFGENACNLLVDKELAKELTKSTFDFKETPQGRGFTLDVY
ncbi:MAG: hypothetical protein FI687_05200 [SAR202 cluster bacterium]|nr:hypothetical protein [SAR202 cluster bacterium]|tara:strand:+ start:38535 stop:38816 length:282 start_codon:yes stop_codon:yes gene_type:complete